jgi:AcrR family transcriptional regulator
MLPQTGVSGLRLREVARRAGVNLGLFHYHFGSKEAFTRRLLQELYEDFFTELSLESRGEGSPRERLHRSLVAIGRFMRQHRQFIMMIIQELLQGHRGCIEFARKNIPRHVSVIAGLIKEGQSAGQIKPIPLPMAMAFAMGGIGVPNLMITMLERVNAKHAFEMTPKALESLMLSDQALEQRAELIVSLLAAKGGR